MKWYYIQFDPAWVRCANTSCKAEYTLKSVQKKRKCPKCKMDNKHCIKK